MSTDLPHGYPAIQCEDVVKRFRAKQKTPRKSFWSRPAAAHMTAVDHVSFEIQPGETFGILGANGSGKSTLIRMISTLLVPDGGRILVYGRDVVTESAAVRTLIHRVSVEAAFFKKLSAWENLTFYGGLYGLSRATVWERAGEILERLGFSPDKFHEPLENLSRGMQQKIAITRAMMVRPTVLLLDEPTTGLDPKSRRQVQGYLESIRAREGVTTLLTTHDMHEAERLCSRVAIMRNGQIIALGTPDELISATRKSTENRWTLEEVFLQLAEEEREDAYATA